MMMAVMVVVVMVVVVVVVMEEDGREENGAAERRLCLPLVISWYLLPVEASSSYDTVHLPHEKPSFARRQLDGAASPTQ